MDESVIFLFIGDNTKTAVESNQRLERQVGYLVDSMQGSNEKREINEMEIKR